MKALARQLQKVARVSRNQTKTLVVTAPQYNFMCYKAFQAKNINNTFQSKSFNNKQVFYFSNVVQNVPEMGDSITEGMVAEYVKNVGDYVFQDETFAIIDTDKVSVEIKAQSDGLIKKLYAEEGDTVEVGKPFVDLDTAAEKPKGGAPKKEAPKQEAAPAQAAAPAAQQAAPQQAYQPPPTITPSSTPAKPASQPKAPQPPMQPPTQLYPPGSYVSRNEKREPLSRMRLKIAERLKDSQNTYALLTTFQECDMSAVMEIRNKYQKDFQKKHGVKLGFMSFFIKAACHQLQTQPIINAVIDGKDVVYRDYVDISVAVATPTGLMVPVLRNCENQSFADIEKNLIYLADKGKNGKITLEDMAGGTFTISNGGVFGSMMGTPILNPPQSGILGMHAIINRPVVRNNQIVARPMMYLALTYDHRLVDGREAATFLKQLANEIEDPRRILLDL